MLISEWLEGEFPEGAEVEVQVDGLIDVVVHVDIHVRAGVHVDSCLARVRRRGFDLMNTFGRNALSGHAHDWACALHAADLSHHVYAESK